MHQLFTTQIYQKKVPFKIAELKLEIQKIMQSDQAGQRWSQKNYNHGYTSYGSWDQMHRMSSTFEALQKKIDAHVDLFVQKLDFDIKPKTLKMNSCWVNVMPANASHTSHIHPHSVISGSFYVDVPAKASGIKFEDPRLGLFMNAPTTKSRAAKENQKFFSIRPDAGDVILFESWLKHEVPLNTSRKPRISVSFNYGWK